MGVKIYLTHERFCEAKQQEEQRAEDIRYLRELVDLWRATNSPKVNPTECQQRLTRVLDALEGK